jgi:adenine deaminase
VLAHLPLPIAGLMSDQPIETVYRDFQQVLAACRQLGAVRNPFMVLSFLALPVIPSLKLTDCGLVDVEAFQLTDLWENDAVAT